MKKKTEVLYSIPYPVMTEGCNLVILSGQLIRELKAGESVCLLRLLGLQDCSFRSVTVTLSFSDERGLPVGNPISYTYSAPLLKRGEPYGEAEEIAVPYDEARSFTAHISGILPEDDAEVLQFDEGAIRILSERRTLEDALGAPELAEQFRVRYGADCRYLRSEQNGLWFCVCGNINKNADRSCAVCHRAKKALTDVNLDSLRAEAGVRVKSENAVREENSKGSRTKELFNRRNCIFLLPIVLLLMLLMAAAPGAISREYRYQQAVTALEAGNYEQAETLFSHIPSYRDSKSLVSCRIPYLHAKELMDAAAAKDLSMLPAAGYSEKDLDDYTTVSILLYTAAADIFDGLADYEDSAALAEECRISVEKECKRLKQIDYDAAMELLTQKRYSEAAVGFKALGDFSDSADMALECHYQKAVALFHFLSSYDVSRISARITTDPNEVSVFSIPKDEAHRLGSGCIAELNIACGNDPADIRLEDDPPEELQSLKDALTELFLSLGDYSDSASYPERIAEETDYTREFYMLCGAGDLSGALDWLNSYSGDFPERDRWAGFLNLYLPFCRSWSLYLGDSTLVPYSIGQTFSCNSVSTRVLLSSKSAVLRLSFGSGNKFTFDLSAALGEISFANSEMDSGIYVAYINNAGHFGFERYDSSWNSMSACEYE